jgi:selenide,water dikinase
VLSQIPVLKDVVLIGGGHSHVAVLKRFGMKPIPGVRITLISRDVDTPYSGMLPGVVAGHYSRDEAYIDLQRLTRFAGARAVFDEAIGLDLGRRQVLFRSRPPISCDVLSINIGSTPNVRVPGSLAHAIPVKPIDRFLDHWNAMRERLLADRAPKRIAVVGGGTGGVELVLAVQHRMRVLQQQRGRDAAQFEYHLFTDMPTILPTHNARVRGMFRRTLEQRGIIVHTGSAVTQVTARSVHTADDGAHPMDEILWTTEASAAPWLAESGIGCRRIRIRAGLTHAAVDLTRACVRGRRRGSDGR